MATGNCQASGTQSANRFTNRHAQEYADRPKLSAEEKAQLDADWLSAGQLF